MAGVREYGIPILSSRDQRECRGAVLSKMNAICSLNAHEILAAWRLGNPVFKSKPFRQRNAGFGLQTREDKGLPYLAARNAFIAMVTSVRIKDLIGLDGFPKGDVLQPFKPILHILNVLKNNHITSIPETDSAVQIL